MAELESQKSNYLVVGAWNPAIIQPEWLRQEFPDVVPDPIKVEIRAPSLGIRFDIGGFFLEASNGMLIFSPKKVDKETLNSISELSNGIANRLQYTPISAAGCNFSFSLDSTEKFYQDKLDSSDQPKDLSAILKVSNIVSQSVQHTYSLDNHNVNIFYDYKGNERSLRINFDYQNPKVAMIEASDMLENNFETALDLSKELIIKV